MADSSAVLRYLARLAPTAGDRVTKAVHRRGDVAPIGWLDPRPMLGFGEEAPSQLDRSVRLDRLVTVDRLHREEHLLRIGWLWLGGNDELAEADVLAPILSAPVSLERTLRGYRVTVLGDAELTPGLIENRAVADVLEDTITTALTIAGPQPPQTPVLARYTQFKAWLRQVTEAAGLLTPDIVDSSTDPWEMREWPQLGMTLGLSIYLARDVDRGTVASDLTNWSARDTAATSLAAVYGGGSRQPDVPGGGEMTSVRSAFALNEAQIQAIERAREEPVTVVSGPPGTGKSHVAAALAVDEVARGKTVLLATQSEHAADVLADLLERHPGPRYVRFGSREHRRAVADDLADGMAVPFSGREVDAVNEAAAAAEDRVRSANSRILRLLVRERDFARGLADRRRLAHVAALAPAVSQDGFDVERAEQLLRSAASASGLFADKRRERSEEKLRAALNASVEATLDDLEDSVELARSEALVRAGLSGGGLTLTADWHELTAAQGEWRNRVGALIEAARRSREHRKGTSTKAVSALASALRSGRSKRRRMLRELDSGPILDVLPLWLGTLRDIDDTLPAEAAMFDVVIFDEASQIDQTRAAPALCRAERAVVVGDPRQLRHVSFVSDEAAAEAATAEGIEGIEARQLDVRVNSLFDAAAGAAAVTQLVEHFRSVPHIIGFSDRRFYGDRLRLMTTHPSTESRDSIRIVRVAGGLDDEVAAAVAEVAVALDAGWTSIGVVSPFRAHAEAIEDAVLDRFSDEQLLEAGLRVGTVHSFQGNERDVIIAALGLGSLSFAQDPHLFNVMVTRARAEMVVVTSSDPSSFGDGLLADYIRWSNHPPSPSGSAVAAEGWIADLAEALGAYDVPVVPMYPVAGYTVDLAVGSESRVVGVETSVFDGDPQEHIRRHLALTRAGWVMRDAFHSRWLSDPEGAVADLVAGMLRDHVEETNPARDLGQ